MCNLNVLYLCLSCCVVVRCLARLCWALVHMFATCRAIAWLFLSLGSWVRAAEIPCAVLLLLRLRLFGLQGSFGQRRWFDIFFNYTVMVVLMWDFLSWLVASGTRVSSFGRLFAHHRRFVRCIVMHWNWIADHVSNAIWIMRFDNHLQSQLCAFVYCTRAHDGGCSSRGRLDRGSCWTYWSSTPTWKQLRKLHSYGRFVAHLLIWNLFICEFVIPCNDVNVVFIANCTQRCSSSQRSSSSSWPIVLRGMFWSRRVEQIEEAKILSIQIHVISEWHIWVMPRLEALRPELGLAQRRCHLHGVCNLLLRN